MTSPLNTASSLLCWSNVLYVVGAILTLGTSALVLFEKRLAGKGVEIKHSVRNEVFFVASAVICLAGTCGAIYFGGRVSDIKDADLAAYKKTADGQIAQANEDAAKALSDAATANQKAQEAKLKAETTSVANTSLKIELAKHEGQEHEAEAKLATQQEQNNQYAHALGLQQQTMAQQMHVSPELNNAQIDAIAAELKPFAGQEVIMHRTSDTVVGRLGSSIANAFLRAGIKFPSYSNDIDQLYQGVSVVVHADQGHPPLADALSNALMRQGIPVNKVAMDSIPVGKVALYLGPQ